MAGGLTEVDFLQYGYLFRVSGSLIGKSISVISLINSHLCSELPSPAPPPIKKINSQGNTKASIRLQDFLRTVIDDNAS